MVPWWVGQLVTISLLMYHVFLYQQLTSPVVTEETLPQVVGFNSCCYQQTADVDVMCIVDGVA